MRSYRALKKMASVRSRSSCQALEDAAWDVQEAVVQYDRLAAGSTVAGDGLRTREKLLYILTT